MQTRLHPSWSYTRQQCVEKLAHMDAIKEAHGLHNVPAMVSLRRWDDGPAIRGPNGARARGLSRLAVRLRDALNGGQATKAQVFCQQVPLLVARCWRWHPPGDGGGGDDGQVGVELLLQSCPGKPSFDVAATHHHARSLLGIHDSHR